MKIHSLCFGMVAVALGIISAEASAGGLLVDEKALAPEIRRAIERGVRDAELQDPKAFEAARQVRGHLPEVYTKFRNPKPLALPEWLALGDRARWPLLRALVLEAPAPDGATASEAEVQLVDMVEAAGRLREPLFGAVLVRAWAMGHHSANLERALARALGRVGGDAELRVLVQAAKAGHASAIQGLGYCSRVEAADALAEVMALPNANAKEASEALARLGSAWRWQARARRDASEQALGEQVRERAGRALVRELARSSDVEVHALEALRRMGDSRTPAWLEEAIRMHPGAGDRLRAAAARLGAKRSK